MNPETTPDTAPEEKRKPLIYWRFGSLAIGFIVLVLSIVYCYTLAPDQFGTNRTIIIDKGLNAAEVTDVLAEQNIVESANLLYAVLVLFHEPETIKAGSYVFKDPVSVFEIAERITTDTPQKELLSVTFPEGFTISEFATIADRVLVDFDKGSFIANALSHEGFLFPDTYFIPADFSADELLTLMQESYEIQTAEDNEELNSHFLTEEGLIILASIVEREANTKKSMRTVAGILLSRLVQGMPLQVDASMEYVLGKPLNELTADDLDIDSPYNTYLYKGLPPTPIGNPGLISIQAVLDPIPTNNLFYITGNDGEFYYAETYAEHKRNIARYLR